MYLIPQAILLSLHDALPLSLPSSPKFSFPMKRSGGDPPLAAWPRLREASRPRGLPVESRSPKFSTGRPRGRERSEEHTSELQSLTNLVCRPPLEKTNEDIFT